MGEAMERIYGGHLCYGPPIENGFYYDMFSKDVTVSIYADLGLTL
jgi:threonyl-tRNA synthetase